MDIDDLTYGQIKQLSNLFSNNNISNNHGLNFHVGKKVIIRTLSAGVWFGKIEQKCGEEVIVKNARRMYSWKAKKSISLSGVAKYGIDQKNSRIAPAVDNEWLVAIELIGLTDAAIESIETAAEAEAS